MKILFLHGKEGRPDGTKPRFLIENGFEVKAPSLPKDDWQKSMDLAQAEFDDFSPQVVVGSSRGAAVGCYLKTGNVPKILIAPAYKYFGDLELLLNESSIVLHCKEDKIIDFKHSEDLVKRFAVRLIACGEGHRMSDPEALATLLKALRGEL